MALVQNTSNYVKFVRGTKTAWETLKLQNQVFDDTLYFIYEAKDSNTGLLYLGTKLIGGSDVETEVPMNLRDLEDVLLSQNIPTGDILVYNGNQWINRPIEQIINVDENLYEFNGDGSLTLKGFNSAAAGAIPQKDETGSLVWVKPEDISELTEINDQITEINGKLEDVATKKEVADLIAQADHLKYTKVESIDDIDPAEIGASNYIYLVPTGDEKNQYAEYMLIDNKIEPVGTWTVDLNDYVTVNTFNDKVTELNDLIAEKATELNGLITTNANSIEYLSTIFDTLEGTVDTIEEEFTTLKTKVGNLDALVVNTAGNTLVEQVNELTQQLTW